MHAHVPLAAPVTTDQVQNQDQDRDPERVVVSPAPITSLGEPAWEAFYALVFVASAVLVESAHLAQGERVAASLALAAMIPWYIVLGRPVMRVNDERWVQLAVGWRGPVYLTGMIVLFAVVQHANPDAWFLAFALSPQCFQVTTPLRRAMAFVIVLNVVAGLLLALVGRTAQDIGTAIGTTLFAIAFSVVYSRWTVRVIEQSRERAALIAQLESAQAELAAAYHEAGVHAERQRLASEIHDTLAQGFLSVVTLVQAAQSTRATTAPGTDAPDPVGEYLELALVTARENLAEARSLISALAPAGLDDAGLVGAVARAASATGKAAGIEAACAAEGDRYPLPTATEVVLLRVCQEALANVRKHAAATRVDVRLRYTPKAVELTVADNGRGFPTAASAAADAPATAEAAGTAGLSAGFGLRSMSERVRQVGGTLTVASAPGAGTTVRAEIPA
ncbi:MAG TPA: sensor histidine kinase [Trebonia sp.]|nr:sensor histidine kinase [Trebonia sp.]